MESARLKLRRAGEGMHAGAELRPGGGGHIPHEGQLARATKWQKQMLAHLALRLWQVTRQVCLARLDCRLGKGTRCYLHMQNLKYLLGPSAKLWLNKVRQS